MATYKTKAIVLGRHNLGEADRIVIFITSDRGKLRAIAKGVRKTLSRQAGHIEPFSEVELMLAEGRNLDIVTSARLSWYPAAITGDFARLQLAYLMAQMVDRLTGDDSPAPGLYRLLAAALRHLDDQGASLRVELAFKLSLLHQLGYRPQLLACSACGLNLEATTYLSASHGGVVGPECRSASDPVMGAKELDLWRRLDDSGIAATEPIDEAVALASLGLCDTFYEYVLGRSFTIKA